MNIKDIELFLKIIKQRVLEEVKQTLLDLKKEKADTIYVQDIIHEVIDSSVPSRVDAIKLIDFLERNEGIRQDYIDKGLLDTSSLDRFIATLCYAMLEDYIYNDGFINSLQDIDNERLLNHEIQRWIKKIDDELKNKYNVDESMITDNMKHMDTENQIWIHKTFELSVDDFKEPYFVKEQIIDLHDGIKILTRSFKEGMSHDDFMKQVNRNAIVIEHPDRKLCRVYLMDKSPGIDIRELFKLKPSSIKEADYDLNPATYVEGKLVKKFTDKEKFIKAIAWMANKLIVMQMKEEI